MSGTDKPAAPRIYLDANVFVMAFETQGAQSDHAWWVLHAIEEGEIFATTSEITLAEILVKPLQHGSKELTIAYERMIMPTAHLDVLPVRREILINAAGIRALRSSIRLPDAVHIATAQISSCAFFVSEDRRLPLPEGITLLPLNPFTLDKIRSPAT